MQERSDVALKIINAIRKERGEMIRGIERLCDAYITLAYMDATKHKNEKSRYMEHGVLHTVWTIMNNNHILDKDTLMWNRCQTILMLLLITEVIPIPADQPIIQIKDLDEVVIPTMEIKVKTMRDYYLWSFIIPDSLCFSWRGYQGVVSLSTIENIFESSQVHGNNPH